MEIGINLDGLAMGGIFLAAAIIAVVKWAKDMGLKDNGLKWLSFGLGFILGGGYALKDGLPTTVEGWFVAVLYAVLMAVSPSGLVDSARDAIAHGMNEDCC